MMAHKKYMTPFISYNIIKLPKTYELLKHGKKSYIQKNCYY